MVNDDILAAVEFGYRQCEKGNNLQAALMAARDVMGKPQHDERWQQHFNDYCADNFGGREPTGREHDDASAYADQMCEEEEDSNGANT